MRILIDTNILINLEDNKVLNNVFTLFLNQAHSNKCEVLIHGACLQDINRDKNEKRREVILSKLRKYPKIQNPAELTSDFSDLVGEKKINDRVDNHQLLQVYKGYVELFVTNDKGILSKAEILNIREQVLTAEEALILLDKRYTLTIPSHPVLEHVSLRNLEKDFDSPFFESLKKDYDPEKFMTWIRKCAKQDRKCYTLRVEGNLSAILIYNTESPQDHGLGFDENAVKICTFKVGDDALGLKLGELFINKMFEYCVHQKIRYLYVTTYDKQKALIYLLTKFGFDEHSQFENNVGQREFIFVKDLSRTNQSEKTGSALHPFFREKVNKYIVPIQPRYYQTLFKDGNLRAPTLFDSQDYGLQEVQGNTIVKAYISKSPRTDLQEGDLLFFYSSKNFQCLEPLGVLIEHTRVHNFEELWEMVKSKTVYSQAELEKWITNSKYLTVSIFRLVMYLVPPVAFNKIKSLKSYGNKFQTITKMEEKDYLEIKQNHINESFIVD